MRMGTLELPRIALAKSNPDSPGIITSRMRRSKRNPLSLARASVAVSAVVTRYPSPLKKRDSKSRMRRSSSTTSRCGASSGSVADEAIARASPVSVVSICPFTRAYCARRSRHCEGSLSSGPPAHHGLAPRLGGAVGARNQPKHAIPIVRVDHRRQKPSCRLVRIGTEFAERAIDPLRLQIGKSQRKRLTLRRHVKQALPPILLAFPLQHVALVDELLEHTPERLLGDVQDFEQVGNFHSGIAVDEMENAMVRAAKAEFQQNFIGIADEIPISEKQQLDNVPHGLRGAGRGTAASWTISETGPGDELAHIYVSHVDIFCFYVTKRVRRTK